MPAPQHRQSRITGALLRWYRRNGRALPWRRENDQYRILVSEIMLQQTQVRRVLELYPRFLKRFPTFRSLANARTSSVIRAWRGMGYNNRALRLQQTARTILQQHDGKLPGTVETLQQLPGIGRYTAHALVCFVFGEPVPVVDTNIIRVLSRLFPRAISRDRSGKVNVEAVWTAARSILPRQNAYRWNQALMDLGATICTSFNPQCDRCPVTAFCPSAFRIKKRSPGTKKVEPGREGIPNRLYRGKVVEVLRNVNGRRFLSFSHLAKQVKPNYGERDKRWLRGILHGLERDGLIATKRRGSTLLVSLPE
ncbi:MAG: A/G-specific adenine glycosylase [Ignavibacteriales bacterium]|nr:A/G-specific adenine glycosylase [Ignavibacteriales bacterium]